MCACMYMCMCAYFDAVIHQRRTDSLRVDCSGTSLWCTAPWRYERLNLWGHVAVYRHLWFTLTRMFIYMCVYAYILDKWMNKWINKYAHLYGYIYLHTCVCMPIHDITYIYINDRINIFGIHVYVLVCLKFRLPIYFYHVITFLTTA